MGRNIQRGNGVSLNEPPASLTERNRPAAAAAANALLRPSSAEPVRNKTKRQPNGNNNHSEPLHFHWHLHFEKPRRGRWPPPRPPTPRRASSIVAGRRTTLNGAWVVQKVRRGREMSSNRLAVCRRLFSWVAAFVSKSVAFGGFSCCGQRPLWQRRVAFRRAAPRRGTPAGRRWPGADASQTDDASRRWVVGRRSLAYLVVVVVVVVVVVGGAAPPQGRRRAPALGGSVSASTPRPAIRRPEPTRRFDGAAALRVRSAASPRGKGRGRRRRRAAAEEAVNELSRRVPVQAKIGAKIGAKLAPKSADGGPLICVSFCRHVETPPPHPRPFLSTPD